MAAAEFWRPYEHPIASFGELVDVIEGVMRKAVARNVRFAWRGQVNADWALHSSLYRRSCLTSGATDREPSIASREKGILAELHRWGLHNPPHSGRLSVLRQLAMLQHYGAPTRLIDITFNAWVGAFFAVEKKWQNGAVVMEADDARLFAIDVADRLINEQDNLRPWEDDLDVPWKSLSQQEWTTSVYAWKPPALDARISAQNGGFLLGGVPTNVRPDGNRYQVPKGDGSGEIWGINEVRNASALALRPHQFRPVAGGVGNGALYTFRIAAAAKPEIRDRLEKMFGYTHATIYPDFTGFAAFATPTLRSS